MSEAKALKLFVSYAHEDEALEKRVLVHLKAPERAGYYTVWEDRQIDPGQQWTEEIRQRLAEADVVLLLVSPGLIASDYVWNKELPQAREQQKAGKTQIVSVILKPCDWQEPALGLSQFQVILPQGKPISEGDWDSGLNEVVAGLKKVHRRLTGTQQAIAPPVEPATTAGESAPRPIPPPAPAPTRRWALVALALILAVGAIGLGSFFYLRQPGAAVQAEVETGWRLLRIGEYAAADAHFAKAKGKDRHGAEIARLGQMLPRLADERVRREFDAALAALDKAAPDSGFVAYLKGVTKFDDWRLAPDPASADRQFSEMKARYRDAVARDPALAEAHAGLAFGANFECRLDDALVSIGAAEQASGSPPPARYAVQRAEILSRFGDAQRRQQALQIFEARGHDPRARLLQAMLAWQSGQWAQGRDKLADAIAALDKAEAAGGWLLYAPGGAWLLGETDAKRCLLRYAGAVGERLAEGGAGTRAAWDKVGQACPRITEDARDYLCAQLPEDLAAPARGDLQCPSPQPTASCPPIRPVNEATPATNARI